MRSGAFTATLLLAIASIVPLATLQAAAPAAQQQQQTAKPAKTMLLKADTVEFDTNTGVTTARGHVEIDYEGEILLADKVIYDQNADTVTAIGHLVLLRADGTTVFSDHAVLTNQMRDGVLQGFAALIGKTGRLAGTYATRTGGVRTVATRAAYTNCKVCNKPGQRVPVWQVEAARVIYDEPAHRIFYRDAVIDAFGIPIFYTPALHEFGSNGQALVGHPPPAGRQFERARLDRARPGLHFAQRFQDFTIAPFITSQKGDVLKPSIASAGTMAASGCKPSVGYNPHGGDLNDQHQTYSSIFGAGVLQLDDTWKAGYDLQLSSNETWLELYKISQAQRLQSDMYVEGISGRSRFEITGYFFQGLLESDNNQEFPVVLPLVDYTYIPEGPLLGGDFRFDVNTAAISRDVGEESQRLTGEFHWKFPLITQLGQQITLVADTRGDVFDIDNPQLGAVPTDSHYISRGLPYAAIDWRWPFVMNARAGNVSTLSNRSRRSSPRLMAATRPGSRTKIRPTSSSTRPTSSASTARPDTILSNRSARQCRFPYAGALSFGVGRASLSATSSV